MTDSLKNDSDTEGLIDRLTPCEKYIYERAKRKPDEPFCFLDFMPKYKHGSIRNALSTLRRKGLIRLYCRSGASFYVLSSGKPMMPKKLTIHRRVGKGVGEVSVDFGSFLDSLDFEDVCRVHDICLVFTANGFYDLLFERVGNLIEKSGDIHFGRFAWSKERVLTVVVHRGSTVTAYLKCSNCPIEVSLDSLVSMSAFLGGVRVSLVNSAVSVDPNFDSRLIPDVCDWIVAQWHYGKNGAYEISGPAFNVTFGTWFGELARIYMRRRGQLLKPRLEIHEKPMKTLPLAFAEKIDPTFSVLRRSGFEQGEL